MSSKLKLFAIDIPLVSCRAAHQLRYTLLTSQPRTHLRTHPTVKVGFKLWESSAIDIERIIEHYLPNVYMHIFPSFYFDWHSPLTPSQESTWELTQPLCEYPPKWASTSLWWLHNFTPCCGGESFIETLPNVSTMSSIHQKRVALTGLTHSIQRTYAIMFCP